MPEPTPGQTNRQRWEAVATETNQICQPCHRLFNPAGYAFSHYDAVGAFRTTDNGAPVDAQGELPVHGRTIKFANAVDLMRELAPDAGGAGVHGPALGALAAATARAGIGAAGHARWRCSWRGRASICASCWSRLTRTRLFSERAPSAGEPLR